MKKNAVKLNEAKNVNATRTNMHRKSNLLLKTRASRKTKKKNVGKITRNGILNQVKHLKNSNKLKKKKKITENLHAASLGPKTNIMG